jgi:opacity protein-like surface antigen
MPKIYFTVLLLMLTTALHAQTWELGAMGGGAGYMGDLNQTNPVKLSGAAVGGYVKRNFNGYLSLKLNAGIGHIHGADSTSNDPQFYNRNLSFSTRLDEISLIGEFNFLKYIPDVSKSRFTPYLYAGIGLVHFNPTAVYQGKRYDLRSYTTEGQPVPYRNSVIAIPYGAGVKYNFAGKWTVGADLGYRTARTDYLDDVSGLYANTNALNSPISLALADRSGERLGNNIGIAGTQRGDLRAHDHYFFLGVTLAFTFVTQKCYFEN